MKSILLVEDEPEVAELVEVALTNAGFDVAVAHDGSDALDHLARSRPDLVVTDVMMPVVDGLELARRIHECPALAEVPVILMSAAWDLPRHADRASYRAFLRKPFDVGTLLDTVERQIGPAA